MQKQTPKTSTIIAAKFVHKTFKVLLDVSSGSSKHLAMLQDFDFSIKAHQIPPPTTDKNVLSRF